MSEHTKEPWFYGGSGSVMKGYETYSDHIAVHATPENAKRIVACVNACAGIPIERLEKVQQYDAKAMVDLMLKWRDQRDELLTMLKEVEESDMEMTEKGQIRMLTKMREIIAKVEQA